MGQYRGKDVVEFAESGCPIFRATSQLSRGQLKSKGHGKLSIHYAADLETVETIFRITEAWSPWAEGGVVRREGDEIRLVAVLVQVVFRCVRIVLFGTWFGIQVIVGGNKRDAKQLLPDYDKFIPSDAPNHDDWNKLFNDPAKLEDKLIPSREVRTLAQGGSD